MGNSFGQHILNLSPPEILSEERKFGLSEAFSAQDAMTIGVVWASVAGVKVVEFENTKPPGPVRILPLSDDDRATLAEQFALEKQQGRGAWFIPDQVTLCVGDANLPHYFQTNPGFASGIAIEEKGKFNLIDSPDSLYFWAVLSPLFEVLFRPVMLRTTIAPLGDRYEHLSEWRAVDDWYRGLGIAIGRELDVLRYGGGWSKLKSPEQLAAKGEFFVALDRSVPNDVAALHRVLATRPLIEKYYTRAKRGAATMRRVLTKQLHPVLSAYFGGNWLDFLSYIGEKPHPDEQISTSLTQPKLFVSAGTRVPEVAAQHGIDAAEIERMLGAFWPGERTASPVEQRVSVLKRYWQRFDDVHARQASGMTPLWGFVDEDSAPRVRGVDSEPDGPEWYLPGTYAKLLPKELLADIDSLWDGTFLSNHPDRIASTPNPYGLMCRALGPALTFWHGAALTAWFICEGPYSRTDMAGLAHQHRRELATLAELGCPIEDIVFNELVAAEKKLGEPRPIEEKEPKGLISALVSVAVSTTVGSKRSGFIQIRDVITKHRRAWSERHLDSYLRTVWESEINSAAREFSKLYEQKGKAPSLKQFARIAEGPTNHWFGGDVTALFTAFGEKSPHLITRERLLPKDIQALMRRVFQNLGGKKTSWTEIAKTIVGSDREKQDAEWRAHGERKRLAESSVRYVQIRESLGRVPVLKEFGLSKFKPFAGHLGEDIQLAWEKYQAAVESALRQTNT